MTPRPIPPLPYTLHPHQSAFLGYYLQAVDEHDDGYRIAFGSPTGSGKSLMFLSALSYDAAAIGITPRLEIVAGMLEKCGEKVDGLSDTKLAELALQYRITTPIRLRNMLAAGTFPYQWAGRLIVDEAHHFLADTYTQIRAYLPNVTIVGLTATLYRGNPKGTAEFLDLWDEVVTLLNIPGAAERGIIEVPDVELWPLVDDDEIEIKNGEIEARAAGAMGIRRSADLIQRIIGAGMVDEMVRENYAGPAQDAWLDRWYGYKDIPGGLYAWDRPTMLAVSTVEQLRELVEAMNYNGLPAVGVNQETPRADRQKAFADCIACKRALVQIDVVSEGVDLPVRRLIDMRPTFSPVRWMQQLGRITRPRKTSSELGSVYVCCNRNLERHCYLMEGTVPSTRIAEAQQMFGGVSRRSGMRAVGIEGVGRFQAVPVPFAGGVTGCLYNLYTVDRFVKREYAALLHPGSPEPFYAVRESATKEDGSRDYGKWALCVGLPDLTGYSSAPTGTVSPKQMDSWKRNAGRYGLDAGVEPTKKNIQALFLLRDLGLKVRG